MDEEKEKERAKTKQELAETKQELAKTKQELAEMKQELAETKQLAETKLELAETKQELAETKPELAVTNPELAKMEQELADMKQELAETKQELAEMKQKLAKSERKIKKLCKQNEELRIIVLNKGKDVGASGSPHTDKKEGLKFSAKVTTCGPTGSDIPAQNVVATDMSQEPENVETCEQVGANNRSETPGDPISLKTSEGHNYESKSPTSVPSTNSSTVQKDSKEPEDKPYTSAERETASTSTSWSSISETATIKNGDDLSQKLNSCRQKLSFESLPESYQLEEEYTIETFMTLEHLSFDHVAYLITQMRLLLMEVHKKGIMLNHFSWENVSIGCSFLTISDPKKQATLKPWGQSEPMLERCQSDLIQIVTLFSDLFIQYLSNKAVNEHELRFLSEQFRKFRTDILFSQYNAILDYFIPISIKTKELHPLITEYTKDPNFTIWYEGRKLHLFKDQSDMQGMISNLNDEAPKVTIPYKGGNLDLFTETACFAHALKTLSQDDKYAQCMNEPYMNENPSIFLVLDTPNWRNSFGEDMVQVFESGFKRYSLSVTELIRFCKDWHSHEKEKGESNEMFKKKKREQGIYDATYFMRRIEWKFPKLRLHVLTKIYMYNRA